MEPQLPFFNLALKKALALETDSFKRAKIKIVLTIILCTILKLLIVIPIAVYYGQELQLYRVLGFVALFIILGKVIMYKPAISDIIAHIMLISGILVIWSNVFFLVQRVNVITVQMIFTVALVSYYLIGGVRAAIFTALAILPVLLHMLLRETSFAHFNMPPQELSSPGAEIIIILNFITFVLIHYWYYRAFHENLREKDELNKQLQQNIHEVKALADSRSVFLSTMSHELRTPLNGVIGMTTLLKDTALEEQKDYLNVLEFSATNLLSVVNDILDYNKIELDKIELESVPVSISALLKKICTGLKMKTDEKGLDFELTADGELNEQLVLTDPTRLTQIIYNLAGNAIKFTSAGSVGISVKVTGRADDKLKVLFAVTDTGIGIAADRQEAIFDIFTQASSDTTRKYGGTGLGLAIVKRLLKLFNSRIELESHPEKGSVFAFSIDFELYHGLVNAAPDYHIAKTSMKGMKLLIAEDNNINVLLLQKLLEKWDIESIAVPNGYEAVKQLTSNSFDGVLMDIHMPVMDGYAATLAIRAFTDPLKARIPIIAITASVSHNIYTRISEVGMQDFLSKPFQSDQLYEKLQYLYKPIYLNNIPKAAG